MAATAPVVVIDNGSDSIKIGFAQDLTPTTVPCVVGRPRATVWAFQRKEVFVGSDAEARRGVLSLESPMKKGIIENWDDMGLLWENIFNDKLDVDPADHPILLTEAPFSPPLQRKRTMEVWFETFKAPSVFIHSTDLVSLYASDRLTGLVLDIGKDETRAVPIVRGRSKLSTMKLLNIGGKDLTDRLGKLLMPRYKCFTGSSGGRTLQEIKEKLCFVSENCNYEPRLQKEFEASDGTVIKLGEEVFRCPEALFEPWLINGDPNCPGIHQLIHNTIKGFSEGIREELYANIVLSGGTTLMEGLADRLKQELTVLDPEYTPTIISLKGRENLSWTGGAILGSLDNYQTEYAVSKAQFDEFGAAIFHSFTEKHFK